MGVTPVIILSCQGDGGRTTEPSTALKSLGCCPGNMVVFISFFLVSVVRVSCWCPEKGLPTRWRSLSRGGAMPSAAPEGGGTLSGGERGYGFRYTAGRRTGFIFKTASDDFR